MRNFNFTDGEVLLIDKPYKWTSFDVISKLRSHIRGNLGLRKLKVGHAGTLDPLATGLVVVCTGRFTKRITEFQDEIKEYTGTICLGATTPSFDLEKEIDQTYDISHLTEKMILDTAHQFIGEMDQMPPQFSAKKIKGKHAYEFARKNQEVDLQTRKIIISEFEITDTRLPEIDFRIVCTKGTYIRAIARDFGEALNCGGHLTVLRRTRNGQIRVEEAQTLDEIMEEISACANREITEQTAIE